MLAIAVNHNIIGTILELVFNEPQQMLLIHTRRVMDVGIYLTNIIEISMWNALLGVGFAISIEQHMDIELRLQNLKLPVGITNHRTTVHRLSKLVEILSKLIKREHVENTSFLRGRGIVVIVALDHLNDALLHFRHELLCATGRKRFLKHSVFQRISPAEGDGVRSLGLVDGVGGLDSLRGIFRRSHGGLRDPLLPQLHALLEALTGHDDIVVDINVPSDDQALKLFRMRVGNGGRAFKELLAYIVLLTLLIAVLSHHS